MLRTNAHAYRTDQFRVWLEAAKCSIQALHKTRGRLQFRKAGKVFIRCRCFPCLAAVLQIDMHEFPQDGQTQTIIIGQKLGDVRPRALLPSILKPIDYLAEFFLKIIRQVGDDS